MRPSAIPPARAIIIHSRLQRSGALQEDSHGSARIPIQVLPGSFWDAHEEVFSHREHSYSQPELLFRNRGGERERPRGRSLLLGDPKFQGDEVAVKLEKRGLKFSGVSKEG